MDADILEQLYSRYYSPAFAYCMALCADEFLAQDLVADAFVKAYLSLPNDTASFRFWLLRVCKNLWIDHLRSRKHEVSDEALCYLADHNTPEIVFLKNEKNRYLWRYMQELSPGDRELLTLHYFSGVPLQEIAQMSGRTYASVRQRMTRLRRILRKRMEDQGYGI